MATHKETKENIGTRGKLPYLLHVPLSAPPSEGFPLVVFLHGSGECGSDLSNILPDHSGGLDVPPRLAREGSRFLAGVVVATPQAKNGWGTPECASQVGQVVEEIASSKAPINRKKMFLVGLSNGGMGVWNIAAAKTAPWAALCVCCGFWRSAESRDSIARSLKDVPVWVAHGVNDESVRVHFSDDIVEALRRQGNERVVYRRMENCPAPKGLEKRAQGHDCWKATFRSEEFWSWLLSH